jgi:hypothetical protein
LVSSHLALEPCPCTPTVQNHRRAENRRKGGGGGVKDYYLSEFVEHKDDGGVSRGLPLRRQHLQLRILPAESEPQPHSLSRQSAQKLGTLTPRAMGRHISSPITYPLIVRRVAAFAFYENFMCIFYILTTRTISLEFVIQFVCWT